MQERDADAEEQSLRQALRVSVGRYDLNWFYALRYALAL